MIFKKILLVIGFLGLTTSAFAQKKSQKPADLLGITWELVSMTKQDQKQLSPHKPVKVVFSKDGMSYNPDCNQCGRWAKIDPKKQQISFNPSQKGDACTELKCLNEQSYHFPYETLTYTKKGEFLELKGKYSTVLLKKSAQ